MNNDTNMTNQNINILNINGIPGIETNQNSMMNGQNQNVVSTQQNPTLGVNVGTSPIPNNSIVNDVSIKVTELGPEGKKQIIVNGQDITYLPVNQLTEELADAMTEEQAAEYIKGFNEEEIELFREVYGFIITAPKMSEEELNKRSENRAALAGELSSNNVDAQQESVPQPVEQKREQTGSVIFGSKN